MNHTNTHICLFNSHKEWGGGEKWHSETATLLFSKKHNVVVCGNAKGKLLTQLSPEIPTQNISLSNLSFLNPFKYVACYRIFKKHQVKTVILCLPIDVKVAGIAAKCAGVKNIVYRRGCAIPIKNKATNRFLFSRIITHIIANSQATKESILACNPQLFPRDKITVLYNGIQITDKTSNTELLQTNQITIGTAGRLEPQKNMHAILSIAELLQKRTLNFTIKIAGEGSLFNDLQKQIDEKSLESHIQLVGFQKNMNQFYESIDIFILTSHGEGFGYVFAEAMLHNLPLVAYNVSSSQELITENYNGFLIPKDNIDAFADKLALLIENSTIRTTMGTNAGAFVRKHFDANIINIQTEAYIVQL